MITCGPWHPHHKDWCKKDVMSYVNNYFGANIKQTHNVAEIGSGKDPTDPYEGFHHIHQPIQFHKACKPFGIAKKLREHMNKTWPKTEEMKNKTTGFSVHIDSVPRKESKEGLSPYEYICMKYIENPVKDKEVDEDGPLSNKVKDKRLEGSIGAFAAQSYKNFKKLSIYHQRLFLLRFAQDYPNEVIFWDWQKIPVPSYKK